MKCKNCGAPVSEQMQQCEYCGSYLPRAHSPASTEQQGGKVVIQHVYHHDAPAGAQQKPVKSKRTIFLLCLFLGLFGVHRFYVGKIGAGMLYLFTRGLFYVGWIIDLIMIALGRFTDKWGRELA